MSPAAARSDTTARASAPAGQLFASERRRRVLIIEDDCRVRQMVQLALAEEGFAVEEVATGEEGIEEFGRQEFDVVCLDLLLPGRDGLQVCREIRRESSVPIIVVTARSDSDDVVCALEAGADDYISKPFRIQELSARIRALLRRADGAGLRGRVQVGPVEILPRDGLVLRSGDPVEVTRTEFRVLRELAESRGAVLSREELLERVWGRGYFGDIRLVDVHVGRLRRKIESNPRRPQVVVTVRGMGYRLGM